jgi:putative nucleotidyltransferase with HDIG domain
MPTSLLGETVDIAALLDAADKLAPLPTSAVRLTALAGDPGAEIHDVVDVVELDQSLAASVLRVANSAASGNRVPIGTVQDAVVRLGMSAVTSIALSSHLSNQLNQPLTQYRLEAGDLWRESVLASIAADLVRSKATIRVPAEAVTAALLHDIGKVVLCRFRDDEVEAFIARGTASDIRSDFEAERVVLGLHHGEVGALIAQNWRLPEPVVHGVQYHHSPSEHPEPVCYAVALADAIADRLIATWAPEDPEANEVEVTLDLDDAERISESMTALGMSPAGFDELATTTAKRFDRVRAQFQIDDQLPGLDAG